MQACPHASTRIGVTHHDNISVQTRSRKPNSSHEGTMFTKLRTGSDWIKKDLNPNSSSPRNPRLTPSESLVSFVPSCEEFRFPSCAQFSQLQAAFPRSSSSAASRPQSPSRSRKPSHLSPFTAFTTSTTSFQCPPPAMVAQHLEPGLDQLRGNCVLNSTPLARAGSLP